MPKTLSLKVIKRRIAKLQAMEKKVAVNDKSPSLKRIAALMRKNDVSVAELRSFMSKGKRSGTGKSSGTGKKVKPKYKDPASGAKWSGRGRAPLWIVAGEKAGKKRESFLIS